MNNRCFLLARYCILSLTFDNNSTEIFLVELESELLHYFTVISGVLKQNLNWFSSIYLINKIDFEL